MNRLVLTILLTVGLCSVQAQITSYKGSEAEDRVSVAKEVAYSKDRMIPLYIEFKEDDQPAIETAWPLIADQLDINQGIELKFLSSEPDDLGMLHQHYALTYLGYSIEMAWLNIHSKDGKVVSVNGNILANPKVERSISINEERALSLALNDIGAQVYKWELPSEEKNLKNIMDDPNATYYPHGELVWMNSSLDIDQQLKLCYKFNIYAHSPKDHRYNYYVNSKTGEIEYVESLIHSTDKQGTAYTGYSGVVTITTDSVSNFFRLRESGRGRGIETYNMLNTRDIVNAIDFIDSNNVWNAFSPAIDKYSTDAHFGAEKTYDYFSVIHNRNSIDNNGFKLVSYVHYGVNVVNAFWNGNYMTYGDGNASNTPLTTLDICGHEVAHGLTQQSSRLIYANESGALNESFSDIFGVAVENFARPNNWNWTMGEEIGSAFRDMSNPKRFGDPDTYEGVNWIDQNCIPNSGNDQCGVHTNSGVQNYWFYLLTVGGTGTNDKGDAYSVSGMGIILAAKVAFRNNVNYLGRSSDYHEARFFGIKSAVDFFGACSPQVQEVTNAWYAVGVGAPYNPNVSADFEAIRDTSYCYSPARVDFDSDGSNALSFLWSFGDGSTSTQADPSHFYSAPGTYSVQLIADGGACGSDTVSKQAYIVVDPTARCSYFLGTDRLVNACSGNLYDNGGLNGNYASSSLDTLLIAPSNSDQIVLYFESFDMQNGDQNFCNKDFLEIYDGDVGSSIIGRYCGNNPPPDSIVSSSNKLALVFSSDLSKVDEGFRSSWRCKQATVPPRADFYTPADTVCSAEVQFIDNSSGAITSWYWDFGDGSFSTERNPTHFYQNDGSYTVSLRATNSAGGDIVTKANVINVQRLPMPSTLSDTACIGGRVKLAASGNGTLQWFDQAAGGELMFQGDTLRLNNRQSDTSFYVQYFQRPSAISGPFSIPGNGYYSDSSEAIYFDVYEPMILESVIVNSNKIAPRRIDLRNSTGKIIQTKTLPVSGVPQQIQIGFVIYPGTNYSLSIGSSNPSLYVNSTGASYPYSFGSYMNLTGSSLGPNGYPFFYYWTIRPLTCYSSRAYVEGKIDSNCVLTDLAGDLEQKAVLELFPNPSQSSFHIKGMEDLIQPIISIYSVEGRLIRRVQVARGNSANTFGSELPSSIYLIQVEDGEELHRFKWVKTD